MSPKLSVSLAVGLALYFALILTGCGDFFPAVNNGSSGSSGSTGSTGPTNPGSGFIYVANLNTQNVAGFAAASGTLSALPGSPYNFGLVPTAISIAPGNTRAYVATAGVIDLYTMNSSTGALSNPLIVANASVLAMDISPDGKWLFALDSSISTNPSAGSIDAFSINSDGTLSSLGPSIFSPRDTTTLITPSAIHFSPNGQLLFLTLGNAGEIIYTFDTSTGLLNADSSAQKLSAPASSNDSAIAIDSNTNYMYLVRTGVSQGLSVYSVAVNGGISQIGSPYSTGSQPSSVAIGNSGTTVYVANRGDSTISAYNIGSSAALTAVTGSPFASGTNVNALTVDSSGKYLLAAANGGNPDLTIYTFDSTTSGKINSAGTASTGVDPTQPLSIAAAH